MKKVSTVATKTSRNFSQQKLTIGLDLGDRTSYYCVLEESGRVVVEQRVSTTAKALGGRSTKCRAAGSRWRRGCTRRG